MEIRAASAAPPGCGRRESECERATRRVIGFRAEGLAKRVAERQIEAEAEARRVAERQAVAEIAARRVAERQAAAETEARMKAEEERRRAEARLREMEELIKKLCG
jgi:hypothetical protein